MKATPKFVAWLAVAALLVGLGVSISFYSFMEIGHAADARKHGYIVLHDANELQTELSDAETGLRGFLLTGDELFLQPYLAVVNGLQPNLARLRQETLIPAAQVHLDAVAPLLETLRTDMAQLVELRRDHDMAGALAVMGRGDGKRAMDAIRAELAAFIVLEEAALAQHDAELQHTLARLFNIIVVASLLTLVVSLLLAYLAYRETQQRLRNALHLETRHLLAGQEETNRELQLAHTQLQDREEKLKVTLNSIGDAVITTDALARVTLLNPLAERLTGWTSAHAVGRPVSEVFQIFSKSTREAVAVPVLDTLAHGTIQGLANHTVLVARDGNESDIADSCAPICDRDGRVVGAVLVFRDVTHEYAAQQAARDNAALVQNILNTVVDGIITVRARGGTVQEVNPAAERMFGYSAAELAGQGLSLLIPELEADARNVNGSLEYYSASEEARAIGVGREVTGRRKDGSNFPMEMAVSEMWLGGQRYFTGILRDITARKQAEDALARAEPLQRAIFNSANFSSIATDATGVIQIFNVGAERMLGYAADDVVNKITPADISDPQEVIARAGALSVELSSPITPGFEALVFKATRGIEDIYELTYIRKDGSRLPAVVSVTALRDAQGAIIGYLLIGTDNTARKRVEEERTRLDQALQEKNIELDSARVVAEKANSAKTDFLSSMSHELRTPLNAILGFTQLMESGAPPPTPAQKRSIDQILKAGWYLLELINEILDLALIESGRVTLSAEPVSLMEVMLECRAMIEPQAHKRGLSMHFPRFETPQYMRADRTRVKQVLINLLFNAIKYNKPEGSVTVECRSTTPGVIRISVRDTGAGMSPEQLGQLFQPFNRLGKESSSEEGTGIGLVVTKRLVELMGGAIGVESTVGVGSTFWVEMHLTKAPQLAVPQAGGVMPIRPQIPATAATRTLLYVEDNPANLELVELLIARRDDLRLLTAADGNLGIEFARGYQPQVILMDIHLPGISGIEAMKILRADPATAHIPIIALSANAVPRDIEAGLEAGFFNYLTKPIKVDQFMHALDAALVFAKTARGRTTDKEST